MKLTHHTDPAHGWLEVPRKVITDLNLAKDISKYSYRDDINYYLEEDCDAGKFLATFESYHGYMPTISNVHTNNSHWIRNLQTQNYLQERKEET